MKTFQYKWLLRLAGLAVLAGCGGARQGDVLSQEDAEAKSLLQGIWMDVEENAPAFQLKGDSIFYSDSTSLPAFFLVVDDTLVIQGSYRTKYPIVRQSEHVLHFKNQNGDTLKYVKSNDATDAESFEYYEAKRTDALQLNQSRTIKRDTIVYAKNERYHLYVQVNPTKQKVLKRAYNDDGVEVENVYYDNSIRFILFHGAQRVFQHDFHKEHFRKLVPKEFLRQSILSDLVFSHIDDEAVYYQAQLAIPNTPGAYIVEVGVTYGGRMQMKVMEGRH